MKVRVACWASVVGLCLSLTAAAIEVDVLRSRELAQKRATEVARGLVANMLDLQLRQLRENGLENSQLGRDVRLMRDEIDTLVKEEMQEVVALLVKAQSATPEEQETLVAEVRGKTRQIVVTLAAERQKLLRRLRMSRLESQVKQLIARQSSIRDATASLLKQTEGERERMVLAARQDQRDVRALFAALEFSLQDVAGWGGDVGAEALAGMEDLRKANTRGEIENAILALDAEGKHRQVVEAVRYAAAGNSQQKVIDALERLLPRLARSRDQLESDRQAALDLVRELASLQNEVRDQTRDASLDAKTTAELTERQAKIREALAELGELVKDMPDTTPFVDGAKAASAKAEEGVFENERDAAVAQQGKVLANLSAIEERLMGMADFAHSDKTAEELHAQASDLEKARDELAKVAPQQAAAEAAAASEPAKAATKENEVADSLEKVDDDRNLPAAAKARIDQAADAARQAAEALKAAGDAPMDAERVKSAAASAESASRALELARAEVEAALDTTKRRALGVEIGELARAAEALERASAAERNVAEQAEAAAKEGGLDREAATELAEEQREVEKVAERIAEGVKNTAPEAAKQLAGAKQAVHEAGEQLERAKERPGEASKPHAAKTAEKAAAAAKQLADAARQLRKEIGEAARELGAEADKQLAELDTARKPIEAAIDPGAAAAAERLAKLDEAANQVRAAQAAQQRAAGREAAAEAFERAGKVAEAASQQRAADAAAENAAPPSDTPQAVQQAAAEQQMVADAIGEAKKGASGELGEALAEAEQAAREAARQVAEGNPRAADAERAKAQAALAEAQQQADAQANEAAAGKPESKPDAAAQEDVGKLSGAAKRQADDVAPQAAAALEAAGKSSDTAGDALNTGDTAAAENAQQAAANQLAEAAREIEAAKQGLGEQQSGQLAEQGEQAGKLAEQAATVDPGATSALRDAQDAAAQGSQAAASPKQSVEAAAEVQSNLQRAAADIAARQQQVRRDQQVAQAIADAAQRQQAARDAIAKLGEALLKASEGAAVQPTSAKPSESADAQGEPGAASGNATPPTPTAAQLDAAEGLTQARQQFAEAQRTLGQGAVDVSGQEQVVNPPIREALDTASQLAEATPGGESASSGQQNASAGENAAGEGQNGEGAPSGDEQGMGQGTGEGQPSEGEAQGMGHGQSQGMGQGEGQSPGQGGRPSGQLGSGFVPNAPEVTAEMIAGAAANAQAAATLGQGMGQGQGNGEQSQQAGSSATARSKGGGSSVGGPNAQNQSPGDNPLEQLGGPQGADSRTADANGDAAAGGEGEFEAPPWFAKLPKRQQDAIRAEALRRAPRGYEERLKRYFQSVD